MQTVMTIGLDIAKSVFRCTAGFHPPPCPLGVRRVGSTRLRRSRNVRYASNTDRIDASQKTVALCQQLTPAPQQTTRPLPSASA
jgi:hypothetical protein